MHAYMCGKLLGFTRLGTVMVNHLWMDQNYLKLNEGKTEFIFFGSAQQRRKVTIPHLRVGDAHFPPVEKVRSLGLLFDANMTMKPQISNCIRSSVYQLRNIRRIREHLNPQATKQLVHAFITSRLDMYNSTLFGLSNSQISRMQRIQNSAARLVSRSRNSAHITPILKQLHWLPVRERLEYKILSLVYRLNTNQAPTYMSEMMQIYKPTRAGLRSGNDHRFFEVRARRSWGDRSFMVAAPRLWNSLPIAIKSSSNLSNFQKCLKTYLMKKAYP